MGINFPASPTEGQVFNASPGVSFVSRGGLWRPAPLKTALPRNYFINSSMTVSQENGDAAPGGTVSGLYHCADQWVHAWSMVSGSFNCLRSRPSPAGADYVAMQVVATLASPAAAAYMYTAQRLEGQRVADFQWGTANAKQAVLRFGFWSHQDGIYTVSIQNSAFDRSFLAPFTFPVAGGGWVYPTIVIPGDTTGTWANDNTMGINVAFAWAAGTTYAGGVAGWQGGNKLAMTGATNGAGKPNGTYFVVAEAGLYLDPYLTGVAPLFETPEVGAETRRCQRYWYRGFQFHGVTINTTQVRGGSRHPTPMRTAPTMAIRGTPKVYDSGATPTITSLSSANGIYNADFSMTGSAGGLTAARSGVNFWQGPDSYIEMNARM